MKSKFIPKTAQAEDKKRQIGISFAKQPPKLIKKMICGQETYMTERQFEKFQQMEKDLEAIVDQRVDAAIGSGMDKDFIEEFVTRQLMETAKEKIAS